MKMIFGVFFPCSQSVRLTRLFALRIARCLDKLTHGSADWSLCGLARLFSARNSPGNSPVTASSRLNIGDLDHLKIRNGKDGRSRAVLGKSWGTHFCEIKAGFLHGTLGLLPSWNTGTAIDTAFSISNSGQPAYSYIGFFIATHQHWMFGETSQCGSYGFRDCGQSLFEEWKHTADLELGSCQLGMVVQMNTK